MMNEHAQGLRKAAILVAALDRATADTLLDAMRPEQAALVRQTVVTMDPVDPAEERRVIDEFLRQGLPSPPREPAGIELDGRLAQRLAERKAPMNDLPVGGAPAATTPFRFLHETEGEELSRVLATERPQTIALVLSHLPPERASGVLAHLAPATQVEVVRRLVDLEETDPEILREVEKAIEARLTRQVPIRRRRVAGVGAVGNILKAAGTQVGREILDNVTSFDPELADQLSPVPTVKPATVGTVMFDDLAELPGEALGEIALAAGPELLALALVGAPVTLVSRLLRQMPQQQARSLHTQLKNLAPTRLSDVDQARDRLVELAHSLAASGRIALRGVQHGSLRMTA